MEIGSSSCGGVSAAHRGGAERVVMTTAALLTTRENVKTNIQPAARHSGDDSIMCTGNEAAVKLVALSSLTTPRRNAVSSDSGCGKV